MRPSIARYDRRCPTALIPPKRHLARIFSSSGAMPCRPSDPTWHLHPTSFLCPWPRSCRRPRPVSGVTREPRNQRVLLSSSPSSSGPALIDNWHGSRSSSGFLFTVAWTTAMACLQVCQSVLRASATRPWLTRPCACHVSNPWYASFA